VQRVWRLIENFTRFQHANRLIANFHLICAFENVADRMTSRVSVSGAAVAWIAFGQANCQSATKHVLHHLIEQLGAFLAGGSDRRLRDRGRYTKVGNCNEIT
jgi:hypothetical protein